MKTVFQNYAENPLKHTRKKQPKKHLPKKHQYLKTQEKIPEQKRPIFEKRQKTQKKNTNS